jgi:xanthine dehydrogenase YagT iron-sulfur-binding subunit
LRFSALTKRGQLIGGGLMPEQIQSAQRGDGELHRHTRQIKERLDRFVADLRADVAQLSDPQARALFEVSAEVIRGLVKSFDDYERRNELAWAHEENAPVSVAPRRSTRAADLYDKSGDDIHVVWLPQKHTIALTVNGEEKTLEVAPWTTLLDLLREELDLTGTKKGCDHGQCGACTVLVDGKRVNSCLTLAVMKDGSAVTTIEGLAQGDKLHPLQEAFIEHDAFQCGYCTPGQICSALGMLQEGKAHNVEEIRELMSGNICRCGAYPNIVAAIEQVMQANGRSIRS